MIVSIDSETKFDKIRCIPVPFIVTMTNTKLESRLFDLSVEKDYLDLKTICEDSSITKVFHNATYDIYVLSNININCVGPYEDTMIMASLVNENFDSKKLKVLAKVHLNEPCLEAEELSKVKAKFKREIKKNLAEINDDEQDENDIDDFDYSYIPVEVLYPYAIKDSIYTLKLYFLFRKVVYERYKDLYCFEISLIPIVVDMTRNGFNIDRKFVNKMIHDYSNEAEQVFAEMIKYLSDRNISFNYNEVRKTNKGFLAVIDRIGEENVVDVDINYDNGKEIFTIICKQDFNPGSVNHLRKAIIELGITITKYSEKKGEISTDKEAIKTIPKDSPNYKFVELLVRWRFLTKQLSTYYIPLYTRYTNDKNSIAHFIFYQAGAKSGRFTAQLVQTIPRVDDVDDERFVRHIRKAFIPNRGKILVAIDYDQIEMRIFADFSKCQKLIDDINNGYDPHLGTAWTLFGKDYVESQPKDKKKTLRRIAKNINFGICLSGDTEVITDKGTVFIKDINIGDKVLTHAGNFKTILNKSSKQSDEIIEITTNTGKILKSTPEHLIMSYVPSKTGGYGDEIFINANDLSIGEYLVCHGYNYSQNIDNYNYEKIVNIKRYSSNINVYDILVEDDHTFIANNLVVHNCYGMGKNKLARSLGIPLKDALETLDIYHKNYSVKQHIAEQTAILYKIGYTTIESNSEIMKFKRDYHVPNELAYKAVNIRIQGMAAYVMKYGIKRSIDFIQKEKLNIPFICSIHDELFFEIDEKDYDESLVKALTNVMEDRVSFAVPILASSKISAISWGDCKEID